MSSIYSKKSPCCNIFCCFSTPPEKKPFHNQSRVYYQTTITSFREYDSQTSNTTEIFQNVFNKTTQPNPDESRTILGFLKESNRKKLSRLNSLNSPINE